MCNAYLSYNFMTLPFTIPYRSPTTLDGQFLIHLYIKKTITCEREEGGRENKWGFLVQLEVNNEKQSHSRQDAFHVWWERGRYIICPTTNSNIMNFVCSVNPRAPIICHWGEGFQLEQAPSFPCVFFIVLSSCSNGGKTLSIYIS